MIALVHFAILKKKIVKTPLKRKILQGQQIKNLLVLFLIYNKPTKKKKIGVFPLNLPQIC